MIYVEIKWYGSGSLTPNDLKRHRKAFASWIQTKGSFLKSLTLHYFSLVFPGFWTWISFHCPNLKRINLQNINVESTHPKEMFKSLKRMKYLKKIDFTCTDEKKSTRFSSKMERDLKASLPKLKFCQISVYVKNVKYY